ncbi:MAG: hypothetical protein FWD58_05885 [Firmicutes bacterium]|nr:hypothetical protein [Bacillota bacterium]
MVADGEKFLELEQFTKASKAFKKALEANPSDWRIWFGYAKAGGDYDEDGDCDPLSAFKTALKLADDAEKEIIFTEMRKNHVLNDFVDEYLTQLRPNEWRNWFNVAVRCYGRTFREKLTKAFTLADQSGKNEIINYLINRTDKLNQFKYDEDAADCLISLMPDDWRTWFVKAKRIVLTTCFVKDVKAAKPLCATAFESAFMMADALGEAEIIKYLSGPEKNSSAGVLYKVARKSVKKAQKLKSR